MNLVFPKTALWFVLFSPTIQKGIIPPTWESDRQENTVVSRKFHGCVQLNVSADRSDKKDKDITDNLQRYAFF